MFISIARESPVEERTPFRRLWWTSIAGFGPADESSNLSRATTCSRSVTEERIIKALWQLRSLRPSSQKGYSKKLKYLNKNTDLDSPLVTENYVLSLEKTNKYKVTLLSAYLHYCLANGIKWVPPRLKCESMPIVVPTEERIDRIISRCSLKYVTTFQISKHGLRPDEVSKIVLRDIDLQRGLLTVRTSKLGAERTIKLKECTRENLKTYVQRKNITRLDIALFSKPSILRDQWNTYRRRAYLNSRDQELLKIRLYDLRHWFATKEYLKTRDLLHVKYLLGHRNIETTMIYVHLAQGLTNSPEDYSCKAARSIEEASALIEAGFDYVCDIDAVKLFRKRK